MKLVGAVLLFLTLLLSGCGVTSPSSPPQTSNTSNWSDRQRVAVELGTKTLQVEVVTTAASITQGLSGRPTLGSDGMLFILPSPSVPQFWMKEMLFDLDLVWIHDDQVIAITPNVPHPAPGTNLQELPLYSPPGLVDKVLEIEAGKAVEWEITPGARLQVK